MMKFRSLLFCLLLTALPAFGAAPYLVDPAGTGTLASTTNAVRAIAQKFNVKNFGATGDGTTDDTAAIQAALNAVMVNGGGVCIIPKGNYKCSDLLTSVRFENGKAALWCMASNIVIRGEGGKASRLFKAQTAGSGATIWFGNWGEGGYGISTITPTANITVEDICIDGGWDGNPANLAGGSSLLDFSQCNNVVVRNCILINAQEHTIDFEIQTYNALVDTCQCSNAASANVHGDGAPPITIRNSWIHNGGLATYPAFVGDASGTDTSCGGIDQQNNDMLIEGCSFSGSPINLCLQGATATVRDCRFYGTATTTNLVMRSQSGGLITGNTFSQTSGATDFNNVILNKTAYTLRGNGTPTRSMLFVNNLFSASVCAVNLVTVDKCIFQGNQFVASGIPIRIDGSCSNSLFQGNRITSQGGLECVRFSGDPATGNGFCYSNIFEGNFLDAANGTGGFAFRHGPPCLSAYNIFRGNRIFGNNTGGSTGGGVTLTYSDFDIVEDNVMNSFIKLNANVTNARIRRNRADSLWISSATDTATVRLDRNIFVNGLNASSGAVSTVPSWKWIDNEAPLDIYNNFKEANVGGTLVGVVGRTAVAAFTETALEVSSSVGVAGGVMQTNLTSTRSASDLANATTTFANVLTATVLNGHKYAFRCTLFCNESVTGEGLKIDFNGGTATATDFRAHFTTTDATLGSATEVTALTPGLAAAAVASTANILIVIDGELVASSAGTFIVRFAQNSHATGTATVRRGSSLVMTDIP